MKTYEEAEAYAKRQNCDSLIMLHENTGEYHLIVGSFDHWRQQAGFKLIAECTVHVTVHKVE